MKRLSLRYYLFVLFSSVAFERAIFVLYLNEQGINADQIAVLQISLFVSHMISEVPTGWFGDRFGKKASVITGILSMALAIFMQYATTQHFDLLITSFILHGVSFAFISGSSSALLYENLNQLGAKDTYLGIASRARLLASVSLGGSMFLGGYIKLISWQWVYFSSVGFLLLSLIPILFLKEFPIEENNAEDKTKLTFTSEVFSFLPIALPIALLHSAITPFFVYGQTLFDDLGIAIFLISSFIAITEITGSFLAIYISKKLNSVSLNVVTQFFAVLLALCVLSPLSNMIWLIGLGYFIANLLGLSILNLSENFFQRQIKNDKNRAALLSSISFLDSICIGLGYAFFGFFASDRSMANTVVLSAVFPAFAFLIASVVFFRRKSTASNSQAN